MKTEFGQMPCRECGQQVKVMANENESLSYKCMAMGCDDTDYATKTGTPQKHASWLKRIVRVAAPAVKEPAKKTETEPKQKTEPQSSGTGFFG